MSLNQISLPRHYRIDSDVNSSVESLADLFAANGFAKPIAVIGESDASKRLRNLVSSRLGIREFLTPLSNSWEEVERLSRQVAGSFDSVLAIGGGKVIDTAKMVARQNQIPVIVMPTALSHDGICSPIAVLRQGRQNMSVPATIPSGIVIPLSIVREAPLRITRAGLGDLVSNLTAAKDWLVAHKQQGEMIDDFALLLATSAANTVVGLRYESVHSEEFLRALASGLILSGVAMAISGTSRPCSGAEHKISHALDKLFGGLAAHGEQVALATLISAYLHGDDWRSLKAMFVGWGLPVTAHEVGISSEQMLQALLCASETRPDRYTILESTNLDRDLAIEALTATGVSWQPPSYRRTYSAVR